MNRPALGLCLLVAFACCSGSSAYSRSSHPFHSTMMEVEWNSETGRFEVALSLWPVDVEEVLRKDSQMMEALAGSLDLDDEDSHAAIDAALARYVKSKLSLTIDRPDSPPTQSTTEADLEARGESAEPAQGTGALASGLAKIEWLGFEIERDALWCYFELVPSYPLPAVSQVTSPLRRLTLAPEQRPLADSQSAAENSSNPSGNSESSAQPADSQVGDSGITLLVRCEIFHELHLDQENSALIKVAGRRFAVRCTLEQPQLAMPWPCE